MKTKINFAIFIILCSIGYFPIVSYAIDWDVIPNYNNSVGYSSVNNHDIRYSFSGDSNLHYGIFFWNNSNTNVINFVIISDVSGDVSGITRHTVDLTDGTYSREGNMTYTLRNSIDVNGETFYYFNISSFGLGSFLDTSVPLIVASSIGDAINEFINSGTESEDNLGHISGTTYKFDAKSLNNNVQGFKDYVSWNKVKSSTGYEYQSGDTVSFWLKDRSMKRRVDGGGIGDIWSDALFKAIEWVAPSGSNTKAIASGKAFKTGTYDRIIYLDSVTATDGEYSFSPFSMYKRSFATNNLDTDLSGLINSFDSGQNKSYVTIAKEWLQQQVNDDKIVVHLAYDIYCQIISPNGKGEWWLLRFHDMPLDGREDSLNGGITAQPVKPDTEPDASSTDWQNINFTPIINEGDTIINEGDTITNNTDNSVTTYIYNNEGDDYYITNNYIYNYDNRSWTENVYNNQDTGDVSDALGAIPIIGAFFGLFLMFFGAFLPAPIISLISIVTPLLLGVFVFRVVKTIIPFV